MKACTLCKQKKRRKEFNKNSAKKDGLSNVCKSCSKSRFARYYKENGPKHRLEVAKRRRVARAKAKAFILNVKLLNGCSLCPETDPCCIDFHHIRGMKDRDVSEMLTCSTEKIKAELNKCITLCSNCHRKVHAGVKTAPKIKILLRG